MNRKRALLGVVGIAAVVLGMEMTRDESAGPGMTADGGMPLRIEFSLVEHAHAAPPQAGPGAQAVPVNLAAAAVGADLAAGALRLRPDQAIHTTPVADLQAAADGGEGKPAIAADAPAAKPAPPGSVRLDLLAKGRDIAQIHEAGDPFGPKSWVIVPPPPPPPPSAPAEAPRAPPLPFRFMGQLDDGRGKQTYFLARGTAMLSVSLGETIDSTYLLERVELGALHFTYLPLRERQSLQFGTGP
jgi:hypothetical protein